MEVRHPSHLALILLAQACGSSGTEVASRPATHEAPRSSAPESPPSSVSAAPEPSAPIAEPHAAEETALRFFTEHSRPALLAIADQGRAGSYRFGAPEYIRWTMTLEPLVTREQEDGAALLRRYFNGMDAELIAKLVLFGRLEDVDAGTAYEAVLLELRDDHTPADGGMVLVHVIDPSADRVVLVFRILQG